MGRDGIREYWAEATGNHREVRFRSEILSICGEVGIVHWSTAYSRHPGGEGARLDGVFVLRFTEDILCEDLREWWHQGGPEDEADVPLTPIGPPRRGA